MEKRCYGCMKLKKQSPICEHCGFNETVQNLPHQLPLGTILRDQYLVGKVLGQGGFGITYMGWDLSLETPVAIKEYYPNGIVTREATQSVVATGGGTMEEIFRQNRERFLREARIQAKLSNVPGIVRVHNLFAENNTAYIIMEFVEGVDLRRYIGLRGACLSVEETFRFLTPVMEALEKVHAAGLVHRDISPDNIMIQTDGTAKLLDFGAARDVGQADVNHIPSQSTEAILKHGFAPLEQYRRRGNLGPWTDVYALCATMYYCMTGTVPSDAPERVMGDDNVNWTSVPGLTEQQIEILEQGMAMMPDKRIASVAELLAGLQGRVNPVKPISTTPVQTPAISVEPVKQPVTPVQPSYMVENGGNYPAYTRSMEEKTVTIPRKDRVVTPPVQLISRAEPVQTETKGKKPIGILVASILAVLAAVGILLPKENSLQMGSQLEEQDPLPVAQNIQPAWENNVLMRDYNELTTVLEDGGTFPIFGTAIARHAVKEITFLDTLADAPADSWDVSEAQNGSVLAWVEQNGVLKIYEPGEYAWENGEFGWKDGEWKEIDAYSLYIAAEGGINAKYCEGLFHGYINATKIDLNGCFHTDEAQNMKNMFSNCENVMALDVSGFDTSKVTDMSGMFNYCSSVSKLDVSGFDTSKVNDMSDMFTLCYDLTALDVSGFDTSSVFDMRGMFSHCKGLTVLDISRFDTSRVSDMGSMFTGCDKLTTLDISNFDTSKVTNMGGMFRDCDGLTNLDLHTFDTSNVTSMWAMFSDSKNLVSVDVSSFDTSSVTDMSCMFLSCESLSRLDVSGFNTSNVTNMRAMFEGCKNLPELDLSNFDTSKVDNYENFMDNGRKVNGKSWERLFR